VGALPLVQSNLCAGLYYSWGVYPGRYYSGNGAIHRRCHHRHFPHRQDILVSLHQSEQVLFYCHYGDYFCYHYWIYKEVGHLYMD